MLEQIIDHFARWISPCRSALAEESPLERASRSSSGKQEARKGIQGLSLEYEALTAGHMSQDPSCFPAFLSSNDPSHPSTFLLS